MCHDVHVVSLRSAFATFVLILIAALGLSPGSASAHAALMRSTPADGATLTAMPKTAELVFNEDINPAFAQIIIRDGAGTNHVVDAPTVKGPSLTTEIPSGIVGGRVAVMFRVTSKDGHPITGEITFSAPGAASNGAGAAAGGGAANAPANAAPAGDNQQAIAAEPAVNGDAGDVPGAGGYLLTGAAALALILVGSLVLYWERQQPRE